MINPTHREPQCDIRAQFLALCDMSHPKDAMWVSAGTPFENHRGMPLPAYPGLIVIEGHNGTLLTTNPAKAEFFSLRPTEDGLAAVLDYVAPKSSLDPERTVIVQAQDLRGSVITEMACDQAGLHDAVDRLSRHGRVVMMPISIALMRRAFLVSTEG